MKHLIRWIMTFGLLLTMTGCSGMFKARIEPHPDAPVGADASENVLVRTEGELPVFDFQPRPHWELGPEFPAEGGAP